MKFFAPKQSPVISALLQVISLTDDSWVRRDSIDDADVTFIVDDRLALAELYRKDKVFAFFSTRAERNLPSNVININLTTSVLTQISVLIEYVKTFKPTPDTKTTHQMPDDVSTTKFSYKVLVIDDCRENLDFAKELLAVRGHEVTLALGFDEGMRQLETGNFNIVLSDMQMPGNRHYPALSLDAYQLDQTYEYGMLMVFEATARGSSVAIVTDANHHGNWMSAALDRLKEATVNGKPVRFFNSIGKRWDIALAALEDALAI